MAITKNIVKKGLFRDSVQMMLLSQELRKDEGVLDAAIVMGTSLNKDVLLRCGLLTNEGVNAGEADTVISLTCKDERSLKSALERAEGLLTQNPSQGKTDFQTIESALGSLAGANLAALSIPGQYVKEVASKMIERKMHIFLFSDHVPLADEVELKRSALAHNLLFMGPEAGTSIINGTVLGFGNRVRKGNVGIIGASGTGIQESSILLHFCGSGITNAIGVGGRDMKEQVGGLMTLKTMAFFEEDPETDAILIVSKPVSPSIRNKIIDAVRKYSKKDYILCLIGDQEQLYDYKQIKFAKSIQAAVLKTLKTIDRRRFESSQHKLKQETSMCLEFANESSRSLGSKQKFARGLFTGGTLCYESKVILEEMLGPTFSNLSSSPKYHIGGNEASKAHTLIDFGEDEFTASRPHPIIDPSLRLERLLKEARDPSVAVIFMDLIVGYSVAERTIELHSKAIKEAIESAGKENRTLPIFVHVCGTEQDISEADLDVIREAGAQIFTSNALMSITAAAIIKKQKPDAMRSILSDYLGDDIK